MGTGVMRLGAQDNRGGGSGDEDKPQGGKGDGGPGSGAYKPVAPDS